MLLTSAALLPIMLFGYGVCVGGVPCIAWRDNHAISSLACFYIGVGPDQSRDWTLSSSSSWEPLSSLWFKLGPLGSIGATLSTPDVSQKWHEGPPDLLTSLPSNSDVSLAVPTVDQKWYAHVTSGWHHHGSYLNCLGPPLGLEPGSGLGIWFKSCLAWELSYGFAVCAHPYSIPLMRPI